MNLLRRFSAASKQVLLLPLLRNVAPETNASDNHNMALLALLINWEGEYENKNENGNENEYEHESEYVYEN